jgi:hypothetical protein
MDSKFKVLKFADLHPTQALVLNNLGLAVRTSALYYELVLRLPHSPEEDRDGIHIL